MKHVITFALAFAAALTANAKTFKWLITGNETHASQFAAYHGETVAFDLAFSGAASNCTAEAARIYYQTNDMGQAWWNADGLVFHPTNDVGAASYRFFVRATDDLGVNYTANGILRMLPSPGFTPSALELPVKTLDFDAIEVLNAPYLTEHQPLTNYYNKGETESKIVELAPAPGDYATVSNRAMTALQQHQSLTNYYTKGEANETFVSNETDPTVPSWAKSSNKPSYTAREVKAIPYDYVDDADIIHTTEFISFGNDVIFEPEAAINVSTNWLYIGGVRYTGVSTFPNDAGYLTSYTETDPTVTQANIRQKLGVWMEYDEETGIYYYCHEEE